MLIAKQSYQKREAKLFEFASWLWNTGLSEREVIAALNCAYEFTEQGRFGDVIKITKRLLTQKSISTQARRELLALRAEAPWQLGYRQSALRDLGKAISMPSDSRLRRNASRTKLLAKRSDFSLAAGDFHSALVDCNSIVIDDSASDVERLTAVYRRGLARIGLSDPTGGKKDLTQFIATRSKDDDAELVHLRESAIERLGQLAAN